MASDTPCYAILTNCLFWGGGSHKISTKCLWSARHKIYKLPRSLLFWAFARTAMPGYGNLLDVHGLQILPLDLTAYDLDSLSKIDWKQLTIHTMYCLLIKFIRALKTGLKHFLPCLQGNRSLNFVLCEPIRPCTSDSHLWPHLSCANKSRLSHPLRVHLLALVHVACRNSFVQTLQTLGTRSY